MQSKNLLEKLIIYIYAHLYNLIFGGFTQWIWNNNEMDSTCITNKQNSFLLTICLELFWSQETIFIQIVKKTIGFDYPKRFFFYLFFFNWNSKTIGRLNQINRGPWAQEITWEFYTAHRNAYWPMNCKVVKLDAVFKRCVARAWRLNTVFRLLYYLKNSEWREGGWLWGCCRDTVGASSKRP